MGGLARHATIVERLRKEADGVILVHAGDDLTGPQVIAEQRALRGRLFLDAAHAMQMDAMGLGERDREAGVDVSKVRGSALITRAGIKVGVYSRDVEGHPELTARDLAVEASALRAKGAKLVIAQLHGQIDKVRKLLESTSTGIDFAVLSHNGLGTSEPQRAGETWIVESMFQGKQIGELDLHIIDGKLQFVGIGARGSLETAINDQRRELMDLKERYDKGLMAGLYATRKVAIEKTIADEKAQLEALGSIETIRTSWMENKIVPLGTDIPDSPVIAPLIAKYKEAVARMPAPSAPAAGAAAPGTGTAQAALAPPSPSPTPVATTAVDPHYVGVSVCERCHPAAVAFWKTTKHAKAWQTLVDKHQEKDASCTGCHVTGRQLGMPNVQCEACHGPGALHVGNPSAKNMLLVNPSEGYCRICHQLAQSPSFNITAYRAGILGKGHGLK